MKTENINFCNLDKQYLELDKKDLNQQLEKIRMVLREISENNYFSTFSHIGKLADMAHESGIKPEEVLKLLSEWNYESLEFIQTEKSGNCNDFAVLCQKRLFDVGVPTTIIGRFPDKRDFTEKQVDFLQYRHTCLLYANDSNDLQVFTLEPSWKFSEPVPISPMATSVYKDWDSIILKVNSTQFTQRAFNPKKNIVRERLYDINPLSVEFCNDLTKRLIRVPRKLQILSTKEESVNQFVRFDPLKQTFTTNIDGVGTEFLPDTLSQEQSRLIENVLNYPGLINYLSKVYNFIISLPDDFWVKD